jgi:tetratricopeptide (TPR) repeat protein
MFAGFRHSIRGFLCSLDSPGTSREAIVSCLLGLSLLACAQPPPSQKNVQTAGRGAEYYNQFTRAQDLAKEGKSEEAAATYERLTESYPDDAEIWIRLGNARAKTNQFRGAAEAYSRALAHGGKYPGSVAYRIASLYANAGDRNQTFAWLEKALAIPLENRPRIAADESFASWRNDEGFRKLAGLAPKPSVSREERWNYDVDFLVAEIRRLHYFYRTHPLPREFDDDVRLLRQRMPRLSNAAMRPEMQRLLARLGDGHTGLQGSPGRQIPLTFYDFSDGLFVIDAVQDCGCIGDRVVALGSTPTQSAVQKIAPFLSVDNAMGVRLKAPIYLRFTEYLRAAGIVPSENEVVVSLEGSHGKHQFTAKATDAPGMERSFFPSKLAGAGPIPRYLRHVNDNYWFEILPDGNTLFFQFNQVLDEPGNTIEHFAASLRAALAPSKIRNLIVDMRHNGGGNLNLFTPLIRSIITFEITHEGSGLYVITSRQTFSAAQVFVNDLDRYTSAVVAGEPSGSRPNFIGESAPTRLPYSGLYMTISTRYHQTDDQDQRTWIAPKIPVELRSADYFANRDPVLDAVLQVIASRSRR